MAIAIQMLHQDCTNNLDKNIQYKCTWRPLGEGLLKLNLDGALFFNQQKARIGAILRDSIGNIIMTTSLLENVVVNPKTIKTVAILRGLQLCFHQDIPKIIVKSDCLVVIKELQQLEESFSILGNLIFDIKELVCTFLECKLLFSTRQ